MENKEKRMIGEYTVINAIHIGYEEIVLAENANAKDGDRYMCCFVKNNGITDICSEALAGEHYAEILHIYGVRIKEASEVLIEEAEEFYDTYGSNAEITKDDCKVINYGDDLEDKVIVIKGDVLYPEHRKATKQLYFCTGGFGASPNSRGTAVFCTSLYDGHSTRFERPDVLGIIEPDNLPQWAKDGLKKAKNN